MRAFPLEPVDELAADPQPGLLRRATAQFLEDQSVPLDDLTEASAPVRRTRRLGAVEVDQSAVPEIQGVLGRRPCPGMVVGAHHPIPRRFTERKTTTVGI